MYEDDVALLDGYGDGRLVGGRADGRGRFVVVESAEIVVEDWLWRRFLCHDVVGGLWR